MFGCVWVFENVYPVTSIEAEIIEIFIQKN